MDVHLILWQIMVSIYKSWINTLLAVGLPSQFPLIPPAPSERVGLVLSDIIHQERKLSCSPSVLRWMALGWGPNCSQTMHTITIPDFAYANSTLYIYCLLRSNVLFLNTSEQNCQTLKKLMQKTALPGWTWQTGILPWTKPRQQLELK